jgi:chemotaxis protein CheC
MRYIHAINLALQTFLKYNTSIHIRVSNRQGAFRMASILIIDDSDFMRGKIAAAVKVDGHAVMEAADGLSGLHMAYTHNPDCIILDLIMPEMDGFKVLKTLHEKGTKIPVIVVTADIQVSVQKQCLAWGAAALINKPPEEKELLRAVREVLSTRHKGPAIKRATPEQMDALKEFVNIGVGRAAAFLNEMVKFRVSLEVPFIRILAPLQFKHEMADLGDKNMASVKMGFHGPFSGTAALVMSTDSASKLVDVLCAPAAGAIGSEAEVPETLREVGNIIVNGVLGSLANILKQHLTFSLPAYAEASIKDLFFSEKIGNDTVFLLVRTRFSIRKIEVEGNIILLLTVGAFDALLEAMDAMK